MKTDIILQAAEFKRKHPKARIHVEPCRSNRIRELLKDSTTCIRRIQHAKEGSFPMQVFYYA
jgi:hypothetical protein